MKSERRVPRVEYQKILYITDLSEAGRFAFPYAASIANRYNAELTVFHVVETGELEKYLVSYMSEDLWSEIKTRDLQEARDILIKRKRDDAQIKHAVDKFCKEVLCEQEENPYVTYDVAVETGDPVEQILRKAHEGHYDLVVIGKHGHGALRGVLMGDTARHVIRHCKVPVMVVQLPDG